MNKFQIAAAAALLCLAVPIYAAPAAPTVTASAALDGLKGKRDILFVTTRGGTQMLGRVVSGDHGQYVFQAFHYVTAPAATPRTTTQTTYERGRNGRLRPVTKRTTTSVTTQNIVPDAAALRALVSGAAGPSFRPAEQPASRELVSAVEVQTVQTLLPPTGAPGQTHWTLTNVWPAPAL